MQVFVPIYARKKGCPKNRTPKFEGRGGAGVEALSLCFAVFSSSRLGIAQTSLPSALAPQRRLGALEALGVISPCNRHNPYASYIPYTPYTPYIP